MAGKTSTDLRAFWLLLPIVLLYLVAEVGGSHLLGSLMLPSDGTLYIRQPWSLITYAFVHTSWRHLAINVGTLTLALLFAYSCRLTAKEIVALFGIGSVAGGLLYLLIGDGILLGASAGIATLLPVVLYRVFKGQPARGILFIGFVVLFDTITRTKLGEVTLGVHLIGYLVGILSLFLLEHGGEKQELSSDELAQKAKTSGYTSLSEEEREAFR